MKPNDKDTSWKVKVRRFKSVGAGTTTDDLMVIPQKNLCTEWPKVQKPLGRPINTNMAVKFIRNFLDDHNGSVEKTRAHFVNAHDEDAKEFLGLVIKYLDRIIKLNYAMSLDKNMALKVLSQPRCEGLRFYLCEKKKDGDVLEQVKSESQDVAHDDMETSLVVVGFDACGRDLNYRYPNDATYQASNLGAVIPAQIGAKAIKNVKMQSLNVEYVTPPGGGGGIVPNVGEPTTDEFVLLKYAKNE